MTEAERDEYLRLFSRRPATPGKATRWLQQWMREKKMKEPEIEDLPEYDEMFQKFIEESPIKKRLLGLTPEQVLGQHAPEQRLAGLAPEHMILALPIEGLRALSEEYVRSLPPEVQAKIRRRLQGES